MSIMTEKQLERASVYFHQRDTELKTLLEARARANNRSLSAEMVVTLWRGLEDRPCRKHSESQLIKIPLDKASHE